MHKLLRNGQIDCVKNGSVVWIYELLSSDLHFFFSFTSPSFPEI